MKFDKVKLINSYFRLADKSKIEELKRKVLFSDRQLKIFDLYYVQGKDCGFIADSLCVCPGVITKELHAMREDGVDCKKVMAILAKGLRNKLPEIDVYEEVYREVYGDELTPEKCDELIACLHQGEENGAKWSLGDTNGVASKLDIRFDEAPYTPEMFRAAIHIQYYDCAVPLKKSGKDMSATDWGRMADFYFTADDEDGSRLVDYYFQKMRL